MANERRREDIVLDKDYSIIAKRKGMADEREYYLGRSYKATRGAVKDITLSGEYMIIPYGVNLDASQAIADWYRRQAEKVLLPRLKELSERYGLPYASHGLSGAYSYFGVCYMPSARILLNWRLLLYPMEVIDYVIVHELCHTLQSNHSKLFWQEVERRYPDYKRVRDWLKRNGKMVRIL